MGPDNYDEGDVENGCLIALTEYLAFHYALCDAMAAEGFSPIITHIAEDHHDSAQACSDTRVAAEELFMRLVEEYPPKEYAIISISMYTYFGNAVLYSSFELGNGGSLWWCNATLAAANMQIPQDSYIDWYWNEL